jgi:hypothetical protein
MTDSDATQGDNMSPAQFAKLMGAYPQPAENPLPTYGGFMDNSAANFSWVQNNDYFGAESFNAEIFEVQMYNHTDGIWKTIGTFENLDDAEDLYFDVITDDKGMNTMRLVVDGVVVGEGFYAESFNAEGMTHCKNTYCELPYDPEIFGIDYQKPDAKFGYCACEMCDGCGGLFSTDLLSSDGVCSSCGEFVGDFNRATMNEDYWLACPNSVYSGGNNKNCKEVIRGGGYGYVCENCGEEFHENAELNAFKMAETFEADGNNTYENPMGASDEEWEEEIVDRGVDATIEEHSYGRGKRRKENMTPELRKRINYLGKGLLEAETFEAEDDKDYIDSELEMMMDEALGIKGENYLWSGVTFAEDGAYFDLNAGPGGLYPAHPLRKKIDDFMESCGYPPSPHKGEFPNPYYYFFDNPSKDAESFNAETFEAKSITKPMKESIFIQLPTKTYRNKAGVVHFPDSTTTFHLSLDSNFMINSSSSLGDFNTCELYINSNPQPHIINLPYKTVVSRIKSAFEGKSKSAETFEADEWNGLSAEEYYAEMEELTDGVASITNRFGDGVGIIQVDDEDLEDVSVEITDGDGDVVYEGILGDEDVPEMEEDDFYYSEDKKKSILPMALGIAGAIFAYQPMMDFLARKTKKEEKMAETPELIENPNTGNLDPAQYEEMVVESTGYAVDVIPQGLDGSFMGSRFAALPTERYVEYNELGIGAHTDIALDRNEMYLEPEMAMVQASESVKESQAPGQSPYNSVDGEENRDFDMRVLKETQVISLDPAVKPFIPQSMSGYTGNANTPPSVYDKMFNIGVLGQTPAFVPGSGDIGSSHTGSRSAIPNSLGIAGSVGGPLSDQVNANYTDGTTSMSLAQWAIENTVSQSSDTEAVVIDRSSGQMKRVRRV